MGGGIAGLALRDHRGHGGTDPGAQGQSPAEINAGQQQQELLTAPAEKHVVVAQTAADLFGNGTDHPVAHLMAEAERIRFGSWELDPSSRCLTRDGEAVTITSGEFSLLLSLARHPHQPLSRERLIELARGPASETDARSMDVQISRLRRLLEDNPSQPRHIQTVWGFGYVFVPDGQTRR